MKLGEVTAFYAVLIKPKPINVFVKLMEFNMEKEGICQHDQLNAFNFFNDYSKPKGYFDIVDIISYSVTSNFIASICFSGKKEFPLFA